MITAIRNTIADQLWINSVRKHRSRLGWRLAPKYSGHLRRAQAAFQSSERDRKFATEAAQFQRDGWTAFSRTETQDLARSMHNKIKQEEAQGLPIWDQGGRYQLEDCYKHFPEIEALFKGEVGDFIRATYGANFKVYSGVCYQSKYDPNGPSGSQLWHADGGPGTCINLMWCVSPVSSNNGAMECLPWDSTVSIFEHERQRCRPNLLALSNDKDTGWRERRRRVLCDYYLSEIEEKYRNRIVQPVGDEGLVFAFANNLLHKGGYPKTDFERIVCVFHIYPSISSPPFELYRKNGIKEREPFPKDPAVDEASVLSEPKKWSFARLLVQALRRSEPVPGDIGWIRSVLARRGVFDVLSTVMQLRDLRRLRKVQQHTAYSDQHYEGVHAYNAGVTSSKIVTRTRRAEQVIPILTAPSRSVPKERVLLVGPRNIHELLQVWLAGYRWKNIEAIDLYSTNPKIQIMNMESMRYSDGEFDALLSSATLGYAKDVKGCVKEFVRVLKPGGRAAFMHSHVHTKTAFPGNAPSGEDVRGYIASAGAEIYYHYVYPKTISTGESAEIHYFGIVRRS